jgi:hypothetical protein
MPRPAFVNKSRKYGDSLITDAEKHRTYVGEYVKAMTCNLLKLGFRAVLRVNSQSGVQCRVRRSYAQQKQWSLRTNLVGTSGVHVHVTPEF